MRKQGIFRVSGNINTTFALYDYYQRQLEENNNEAVVATTALARLPPNIDYTIHDVAHLLKKLIYGLPGGLLGSTAVFQALYNVNCYVFPDPSLDDEKTHQVKPRMIALALSAINLHFRISLMCSIFGLLRAINLASEQETRSKVKDPHETFVHLRDDALGVVFGPLLLGDKSHHILVDEVEDRGGLLVLPTIDHNTHTSAQKKKGKPEFHEAKKSMERTRRASLVTQMLIDHWEEIAYQMKRLDTLGITAQAYDLPAPQQQNTIKKGQFKFIEKEIRISDSYHTERAPPPDMTAYETVHSNPYEQLPFVEETGTARRRRRSSTRRDPGNPARSQTPQEDLMRFDSYRGARKPLDRNLFIPPPDLDRTARPEMSPIAESFSTRLQTPSMGGVESSPNWTQIFTPPHSATFPPEDSPNWRVVGTPQHDEPEKSSNWHQFPSQQDTLPEESPNWRSISTNSVQPRILQSSPTIHEFPTPGPKESQGSPNWLTIGTPKTPQGPVTASSPNWTEFPTPRVSIENSPNWRLIGTDNESDIPDTPIRRTYTIPYAQAEPEETPKVAEADNISIASSRVTRSSGTSSGARTPTEEVIPELATKNPRSAQPKFSTSEFLAGVMTPPEEMTPQLAARPKRDLTFSSSEISALELRGRTEDEARTDSEAPQKRPSRWGRRAISPVPETRYDTGNVVSEPEPTPTEITRPTTPKPLTFRKKPAGFSIYEDEEETTPKADDLNDDSPILTLRKPNSQADVKLIPRGRRPIPSRPVTAPESSSNLNSVPLQPSSPNRKPRTSVDSDPEEQYLSTERETDSPTKRRGGNSALYAEIRRLQRLVDLRTEEANSTKKELELAQNMANAGTLSHIVRETQEELKVWKNRAEWAEKQLRQLTPSPTSSLGHSHRSSVS